MDVSGLWRRWLRPLGLLWLGGLTLAVLAMSVGAPSWRSAAMIYAAIFPLLAMLIGGERIVRRRERGLGSGVGQILVSVGLAAAASAPFAALVLGAAWGLA